MRALLLFGVVACSAPARPAPPIPPASTDPDQDRVEGAADLCPNEGEVYNGTDDTDGCPDRARTEACVHSHPAEIIDRIFFMGGSAELKDVSLPIVDAIAQTIIGNPIIERVGVVGARDTSEPEAIALQRAESMTRALVARGVAAERLEPVAFSKASNEGDKARVVWFVVLRIDGQDTRPASGDARWMPWTRDCAGSWKAHRERGTALDCDCLNSPPP